MWGKACGVLVTGQHWKSEEVAQRLVEVFDLYGFDTSPSHVLSWQNVSDMNEELEDNNIDEIRRDMKEEKYVPVLQFLRVMGL